MILEASIAKQLPGFSLDVTLKCDAGVTVLFGPSGAGKTLTLSSLAGLVHPDGGRILLHGEILFDAQRRVHVPPRSRGIGYVFQNDALFPHMTVEDNLLFALARWGAIERRRRSRALLETFHIAPLASRLPRELSGGEKQRVAIARALATEPRVLLLDEPARGLDYELRQDLYRVLAEVRARYQIPILLVTHDRDEGFRMGDRLVVYSAGHIVQEGPPEAVFAAPRDRSVARLLGYGNIFEGIVEHLDPAAGTSRIRAGKIALTLDYLPGRLLGDRVEFCIAAHRVKLGAGENAIDAEFIGESRSPSSARLLFRAGAGGLDEIECEFPLDAREALHFTPGHRLKLAFPRASLHVFG